MRARRGSVIEWRAVSEVVWRPDRATVEHANATRLVRRAGVADFAELVRRSQEDPAWFWPLAVEDLGLEFSQPVDAGARRLARPRVDDLVRRRDG